MRQVIATALLSAVLVGPLGLAPLTHGLLHRVQVRHCEDAATRSAGEAGSPGPSSPAGLASPGSRDSSPPNLLSRLDTGRGVSDRGGATGPRCPICTGPATQPVLITIADCERAITDSVLDLTIEPGSPSLSRSFLAWRGRAPPIADARV